MIEIDGKQVFTELSELVDPTHTALLVVDMQRDFVAPGGAFDFLGIDLSMFPPMIPRLRRLLDGAREAGVRVVHVAMTSLPDGLSDSPAQLRFNLRLHRTNHGDTEPMRYGAAGTDGHEFIPELAPRDGELVVEKYRSSAFRATNLDLLLRSNGIQTVVMTGGTTEGCVESTARDAMFEDYYVVVAEDCVASDDRAQHEASMLLMRHRFDIFGSDEILGVWGSTPA
jgi:nicotinamidase-related amidase